MNMLNSFGINQHDQRLIPALYAAVLGADVRRCKLSISKTGTEGWIATVTYSYRGKKYYEADGEMADDAADAARNLTIKLLKGAATVLDYPESERAYIRAAMDQPAW